MEIRFKGKIWYWRGPSLHYFVTVPPKESDELKAVSSFVTYGWGMIPATAQMGKTEWKTPLFPKDGGYIEPLKDRVRNAEHLDEGDRVTAKLEVR